MIGNDTERGIVRWLVESGQKGVPINKAALKFSVKKIVEETSNKDLPFKDNVPGRKWLSNFMACHPEITERKSEFIHKGRASVTEKNIRSWFQEVGGSKFVVMNRK